MINTILRILSNFLYRAYPTITKFKKKNPELQILAAGATKARKMDANSEPGYEMKWATAKRRVLILATDGFHCGDWFIPIDNIEEANLFQLTGGMLLKINSKDDCFYQFGIQHDPAWEEQTVVPLQKEKFVMKFTPFSLIMRIVSLIGCVWFVYQDINTQQFNVSTIVFVFLSIYMMIPLLKALTSK